jgi:hypothetical protein
MYKTAPDKRTFCYSTDYSSVIYLVVAPQVFKSIEEGQEFTQDAVTAVPARLGGVWTMGMEKLADGPYFARPDLTMDMVRNQLKLRPEDGGLLKAELKIYSHIDFDSVGQYKLVLKDDKINILLKMDHFSNGRSAPFEDTLVCDR